MQTATRSTIIWGDTYSLRANWADASSPIERETEDGWQPTGYQVADFAHSSEAAMREELRQAVVSGDDPDDWSDEIDAAIERMS